MDSREHGVPRTGRFRADWSTADKAVRGQKPRKFLMAFGCLGIWGCVLKSMGAWSGVELAWQCHGVS